MGAHQPTLWIYRGLPGCGKTTRAKLHVAEADPVGSVVRVNRDDLRRMALPGDYRQPAGGPEMAITAVQHAAIGELLHTGRDVVCDDTNLRASYVRSLMEVAVMAGALVAVVDMSSVPLEVCISRDAGRVGPEHVGEDTIRGMHARYVAQHRGGPLPVPELPPGVAASDPYVAAVPYVSKEGARKAVLVDIDGTVALFNGRGPYEENKVATDLPNQPVIDVIRSLVRDRGWVLVFMSGRQVACRTDTEEWLCRHVIPVGYPWALFMRPTGDTRPDHVVKLELFDQYVRDTYDIKCVFDDRASVVGLWRRMGLPTFQVAEGNF